MKAKVVGAWPRSIVVIAASGPSLCQEDLDLVRDHARVIVINTSFRLAPWADALYAMDTSWHRFHHKELATFRGERYGLNASCIALGATPVSHVTGFRSYSHSGAGAISLALVLGARRILLLGYDGQRGPEGQAHWHGDHPKGLSNAASMSRWNANLKLVAEDARRRAVPVINCSRATVYDAFPTGQLEEELAIAPSFAK